MEGPGADSEEKHEPASDIDTAWMDSLKVLDPEGPIREADIVCQTAHVRKVPIADMTHATADSWRPVLAWPTNAGGLPLGTANDVQVGRTAATRGGRHMHPRAL